MMHHRIRNKLVAGRPPRSVDGSDPLSLDPEEKSKKKSFSKVNVTVVAIAFLFLLIFGLALLERTEKHNLRGPSVPLSPPSGAEKILETSKTIREANAAPASPGNLLSPREIIDIHNENALQTYESSDPPPKPDIPQKAPETNAILEGDSENSVQEQALEADDLPKSDGKVNDSQNEAKLSERVDPGQEQTGGGVRDSQKENEQEQMEGVEAGESDLPKPDAKTRVCWYDGHCGVREICAPTGHKGVGKCINWAMGADTPVNATQACADACITELRLDEHHHHELWVNVESVNSFASDEYPNGCRVVFRREPEGDRFQDMIRMDSKHESVWTDPIKPSDKEWVAVRHRHVKRVDPISGPPEDGDDRWMALCTNPCQTDADCISRVDDSAFQCSEGSCQKNPAYWEPSSFSRHPVTLVSAATASYFHGLKNLAASARFWAPNHKMVIYNLGGLSSGMKSEIKSWSNVISLEWEDGVPNFYPDHVKRGKIYAWKPILVNETLHKYGSIFYMDAGSTLAGKIDPVENILDREGIFLIKGQDADMRLSHPDSYKWFGYDKETFKTGPHFSGNTQAFLNPSRYVDTIVQADAKCALDAECITPEGSSLYNHRYDQTTISILAYQPKIRPGHYVEYVAAVKNQLNPDMTQPNFRFVWTARQGCRFYSDREAQLAREQNVTATGVSRQNRESRRAGLLEKAA
eukprot:scaffold2219_cov177-Amphora_coffeaeformis.AAC.14